MVLGPNRRESQKRCSVQAYFVRAMMALYRVEEKGLMNKSVGHWTRMLIMNELDSSHMAQRANRMVVGMASRGVKDDLP